MITPSSLILFFLILINIVGLVLAFWVYSSGKKEKSNKFFSLLTISILLWLNLGYTYSLPAQPNQALLLIRITFGAICLFFIPAYFFSIYFPKEEKRYKILDFSVVIIVTVFVLLSIFTNLIIKSVDIKEWGVDFAYGKLGMFFLFTVIIITFLILGQIFKKYFKLSREEKLKTQYLLVGTSLFALMNLIFNVILPAIRGTIQYYQLGNYSVIFLIGFTAYAIIKRDLFGIKVILTEVFVVLSGILLLLNTISSQNSFEYSWKGLLFVLFLIFGYYLIKATQREEFRRKDAERLTLEIKKLDEAKTQFMLATQHHLRTPLTAIQGYLSMITEGSYGEINPIVMEKIKRSLESTQNLIKLINEFLDIAQFEVGKEIILRKNTQIKDVLQEIIKELQHEVEVKKLYLKLDKPFINGQEVEDLPKMMVDGGKIKEAVYNVVNNSIKYTPTGGVTIRYGIEKDKLKIEIKDTGIGMEKKDVDNLFEKTFERGESAKRIYTTGRGIGLYLSGQIIKSHGGRIWATSEGKDEGSVFHIELPVNISSADLAIFLRKM